MAPRTGQKNGPESRGKCCPQLSTRRRPLKLGAPEKKGKKKKQKRNCPASSSKAWSTGEKRIPHNKKSGGPFNSPADRSCVMLSLKATFWAWPRPTSPASGQKRNIRSSRSMACRGNDSEGVLSYTCMCACAHACVIIYVAVHIHTYIYIYTENGPPPPPPRFAGGLL